MEKFKILLLEGGFNEEHEVSLSTGKEVKKALINLNIEFKNLIVNPNTFEEDIKKFSKEYICFNALHGTFGEDGKIQKILDLLEYRYTHSSERASSIGFNKRLTKDKIQDTDIVLLDSIEINYDNLNLKKLLDFLSTFGMFIIKPVSSGSSFGIKVFKDFNDIYSFINNFETIKNEYKNHNKLLVEKYIKGRELTVAVIEKNKKSVPLEVTEISFNKDFFDYNSKYIPGNAKHILPANIPDSIYNKCKNFSKTVHDVIKCRGVSRSDFIYDGKQIFFLEINTQPGLTPISLVPEQLQYQNISFDELILDIINCSI